MFKTAFLGAGSVWFGPRLIRDIMSFPELVDCTIHLVDPNEERLAFTLNCVRQIARANQLPTRFEATTHREPALDGADYVITSIRVGEGMEAEALDVEIPLEVAGLRQTVADTVGIGGVMKALRSIPVMLDIAHDMERWCPDALLLNYTNPMAMIQWALGEATSIQSVGLCHSVQHTSELLAEYVGVDYADLRFRVAGINHMAWFTELSRTGEDLYPRLRACLEDPDTFSRDPVRFEILRHFGYFVTESSAHMAEYVPYFLKSAEEMSRLNLQSRTGEMNRNADADKVRQRREALQDLENGHTELVRSNEYAALILHAMERNRVCLIYGNVPNAGLIDNLPDGCCVEVPCFVDRTGVHPSYVGALPPQCAALCQANTEAQGLAVKAVLEGSREGIYHAVMLDPNTAAQLSLSQIRETVDRLLEAQRDLIPRFQE